MLNFFLLFDLTDYDWKLLVFLYCRQKNYGSDLEDTDPEMMFAILASLGQTIVREDDMEK